MITPAQVLLLLIPLFDVVWASPQRLKMTPEEYKAFKLALNGNYPVNLQTALTLLSLRDIKSNKFVYVDIPVKRSKPGKVFQPPAHKIHNSYKASGIFKANGVPLKIQRNTMEQTPMQFSQTKSVQELLLPIYRDELDNISPISKRRQFTKKEANNVRRKRDTYQTTEEEKEQPVYAEELSFALSTAGGVLGGAVGGYLDTTGVATLKLIRSLESLGLIAVGQFDDFLDQQENKN